MEPNVYCMFPVMMSFNVMFCFDEAVNFVCSAAFLGDTHISILWQNYAFYNVITVQTVMHNVNMYIKLFQSMDG